jgi:hypothetical protein
MKVKKFLEKNVITKYISDTQEDDLEYSLR